MKQDQKQVEWIVWVKKAVGEVWEWNFTVNQNMVNFWRSTVGDTQSLPILENLVNQFWHQQNWPGRFDIVEMKSLGVNGKISTRWSLWKATFFIFDPQNLAIPPNNWPKTPKNMQLTYFWNMIMISELGITESVNSHLAWVQEMWDLSVIYF